MNKLKPAVATVSRVVFNAVVVIALVVLASLIGVGGAALWIYGRPLTTQTAAKSAGLHLKHDVAATEDRLLPKLTPVQRDSEFPAQLTPARYIPTESEIATISDAPRYTYVSYNGGRQQAHLRVNTVLSTSVPAPLNNVPPTYDNDVPPVQGNAGITLSDPASHYITNAQGRVIGVDGTAGAAAETRAQQVARATTVQAKGFEPEVRIASPVVVRKAVPVDEEEVVAPAGGFNVQAELARTDDVPVLRAQPVAQSNRFARPSMFGASDNFRSFGNN